MTDGLRALFEFFFKYRLAVFQQGDFAFGAGWPLIVLGLVALAAATPAVLSYRAVRGKSSPRDRIVLGGLRVTALLMLLLFLLRPMLVLNAAVPQRNYVGVLIDDSRSMQIADRGGRERADFIRDSVTSEAGEVMKELRQRFQVKIFRFGRTAERADRTRALTFDANETRIGDALEEARRDLEAVSLSGLVVFTDGADNARTPIADELTALRARQVPVFAVGIGSERFAKDVEIRRVESAPAVIRGSTLVADVAIRQRGYAGTKVPLVIEDDGRVIARTEITLPADGDVGAVRILAPMNDAGARTLSFRVPVQPGEQVSQNNVRQTLVYVRGGREKVLYVEGEPRHEMRFIREAVENDSSVQLVVLQRTAENKFLRLGVDGPDELTTGFPKTRAELFKYRAIVLGSVEASFFSRDQLMMLADFVNVRGGGLLLLGGRRAFAEGGYAGTPLAEVMPVVIEGSAIADSLTFFGELAVALTPSGASNAVTQVGTDKMNAAERWSSLPPVSTVNRIRRVKPGAVTLLSGRLAKGGRAGMPGQSLASFEQPVLVYQRFGRGIAAALPIQDSWQWRMNTSVPLDDQSFATFWKQMLRWLITETPGRVEVSAVPDQVNPRSAIELHADVSDSNFVKVNDAQVMAHVTSPSGTSRDIPMEWAVDRDGEYRATFTPDETGILSVQVSATSPAFNGLVGDSTAVRVAELNDEFVDAEMRAGLLHRIADETGGRFYTPSTVGTLAADIALSKRGVTVVNGMDLWDMPINFLLLVGILSAEWGYRKLRGLA